MEKAYKYRIYPNKAQKELIAKTFGCCRFVYNYFLDLRIKEYNENNKTLNYYDTSRLLTILKTELKWLKEPDKDSLQRELKYLDTAYKNFFKFHSGFPKFKSKKGNYKSYSTGSNIKFLGKKIQLPKLGYIRIRDKQIPNGRILNATVSQEPNGHYYVSLCCTDVVIDKLPKTNNNIGIDLGLVDFANMSNGDKVANPTFYENVEKKLIKLQRELSRKSRGGSNWNKARIKIAKLQSHIVNQRNDFLHKLSTKLVRENDIICIEDLDVKEMVQEELETKAKTKTRHKHISDVSWSEFRRQLEYKCEWYGKELCIVDRYFPSSQICHFCGHRDGKKDESIRVWICPKCGETLDRDINAAINILNQGLTQIRTVGTTGIA